MPARHKYRVLYLDTAPTVGGSVISLYQLLRKLDRTRYAPVVVAYAPHAYIQEFRALGADVIEWDVYASQSTPTHRSACASGAKGSAPVRWLRSAAWGSRLYHTLGFVALLLRSVWPRARALRRLIAEKHIDLVHTNIRVGHDREGIIAARMAGVPCVCHVRHHERLNVYDRRLAEAVDALIYISEAVQRSHLEAGVDRQKGRVVYNGLDISEFDHAVDAERDGRGFDLTGDDLAVGIVGRLERWKGHEVFLRAMAEVVNTVPEARGVAVGDMVPHDPDYRSELLALRDELGWPIVCSSAGSGQTYQLSCLRWTFWYWLRRILSHSAGYSSRRWLLGSLWWPRTRAQRGRSWKTESRVSLCLPEMSWLLHTRLSVS